MSDANFIKLKENFICGHCGAEVIGTGYTNHCPKCLWSKHVDINPGDRAESCGGMMEPIEIETRSGNFDIIHQCQKCGALKKNKAEENDDAEAIIALAGEI
ncbi:MAG: RNHCP domain-containing protein [Patescibacteria group bacterium]|nr:RNHCP domain-containing protein [Patescibacteria group bacterium]